MLAGDVFGEEVGAEVFVVEFLEGGNAVWLQEVEVGFHLGLRCERLALHGQAVHANSNSPS